MKTEIEAMDAEGVVMENALDELAIAIKNVEGALRRRFKLRTKTLIPPADGETDRNYLLWALHDKNGWSLQVLTRPEQGEETITLIQQIHWRLRLRATVCLEALLVQAVLEIRCRNKEVQDAIASCEAFTKKLLERK